MEAKGASMGGTQEGATRSHHVISHPTVDLVQDAEVYHVRVEPQLRKRFTIEAVRRWHRGRCRRRERDGRLPPSARREVPIPLGVLWAHAALRSHPQVVWPHPPRRTPVANRGEPQASAEALQPRRHALPPDRLEQLTKGGDDRRVLGGSRLLGKRGSDLHLVQEREGAPAQLLCRRRLVGREGEGGAAARANDAVVLEVELVGISRPHVHANGDSGVDNNGREVARLERAIDERPR